MKKIYASTICILFCSASFGSSALAQKLPKGATALNPAELTNLYSDHTAVWSANAMAYFAADGTMKEFVNDTSKPGIWSVKGNEFCMEIKGVDVKTKKFDGKTYTECWQWYKDNKNAYYDLYSKHWDNAKVDKSNFSTNDIKTLKLGDLIGTKFVPVKN